MYQYKFPRPSVTCDIVLIAAENSGYSVLLIQRKNEPFKNSWALPGGFVDENEDLPLTAARELEEETGIKNIRLEQIGAYGQPGRDPRGHTITIVYTALVVEQLPAEAGDDADIVQWFSLNDLPDLAFDHKTIIKDTLRSLNIFDAVFKND